MRYHLGGGVCHSHSQPVSMGWGPNGQVGRLWGSIRKEGGCIGAHARECVWPMVLFSLFSMFMMRSAVTECCAYRDSFLGVAFAVCECVCG